MATYPCGVCEMFIDDGVESSIFCDKCKSWVYPKCYNLIFVDFNMLMVVMTTGFVLNAVAICCLLEN